MFYLIQVFHQSFYRCMKTTMFYLIQVFHQCRLDVGKQTMFYLIQVFHQSYYDRCMKTTMFCLIQVFHQSLQLQMDENNNVLFNSGVSPIFTITDV